MAEMEEDGLAFLSQVIEDVSGFPAADVRLEMSLSGDLQLDSLSLVEVVFALQKSKGIEIPESEVAQVATVGDLAHFLQ